MGGCISPPVVSRASPSAAVIIDAPGGSRIFTASVSYAHPEDEPDTIFAMYFNGGYVGATLSHEFAAVAGDHTIRAVASNPCGSSEAIWNWKVMSNPPVNPPVVIRENPTEPYIIDSAGNQRIFTAGCDQPVTMSFYLNGTHVHTSSPGVQSDSCSLSASVGEHVIRVIGVNSNGSGETSWEWKINTPLPSLPLIVTRIDPAEEIAINRVGEQRSFSVSINHPAYVNFYLDGILQQTGTNLVQEATLSNATAAIGDHTLWVEAYTDIYWGSTSWLWKILHQDSPVNTPIVEKISPSDPVTSFIGQMVSFQAHINQPAKVIIKIDQSVVFESEQYTNHVTFPCSLGTAGSYSLTIIAYNQNGQGEATWSWTVIELLPPPIITILEPTSLSLDIVKPNLKNFVISVDQLCTLTWIVDSHVVKETTGLALPLYYYNSYVFNSYDYPAGLHELKVRAVNENGSDEKGWVIKIIDNASSSDIPFPTKTCSDLGSMILVTLTPILKTRPDGSRFFEISWTAANRPQSNEINIQANLLRATIRATVWVSWRPCIHEPGGHCTDGKQDYFAQQWSLSETTIIEVPNDVNSFIVGVDAEGDASWMQKETEFEPPVIILLPIFNSGKVSCQYSIELQ
jgi:hypothetical protein